MSSLTVDRLSQPCVPQHKAQDSAMAALSTIATFYKVPCSPKELHALLAWPVPQVGLSELLIVAQQFGLDAIPLAGEYNELPEVERPNIVTLDSAEADGHFVVLYEINAEGVIIADPVSGQTKKMAREDFLARWTGDCIAVSFSTEGQQFLQTRLQEHRNLFLKLRKVVGLSAPWDLRLTFLPMAFLLGAWLWMGFSGAFSPLRPWTSPSSVILWLALGVACLGALWSTLFSATCKVCAAASRLVGGIPLATLGFVYYAGCLIALAMGLEIRWFAALLGWALGTHLYLLSVLYQYRITCASCLLTAAAVGVVGGSLLVGAESHIFLWYGGATLAGLGVARVGLRLARERFDLLRFRNSYDLAKKITSEVTETQGDNHLVVYKHPDCPKCALYQAVIRPAIAQDFGEHITLEERDATGMTIHTPLLILKGSLFAMFLTSQYEEIAPVLYQSMEGAPPPLHQRGLLVIHESDT